MRLVRWASTLSLKPAESQWVEKKQNTVTARQPSHVKDNAFVLTIFLVWFQLGACHNTLLDKTEGHKTSTTQAVGCIIHLIVVLSCAAVEALSCLIGGGLMRHTVKHLHLVCQLLPCLHSVVQFSLHQYFLYYPEMMSH